MYNVILSLDSQKYILKLPLEMQLRIESVLERIRVRPYHFVKKVVGTPYYRLRVGDYRIILDIKDDKLLILVIEVAHRRNVYK